MYISPLFCCFSSTIKDIYYNYLATFILYDNKSFNFMYIYIMDKLIYLLKLAKIQ